MDKTDLRNPVALSVVSCPVENEVWKNRENRTPGEMVDRIITRGAGKAQEHVAQVYGENILDAAERIIDAAEKKNIRILTYWDEDYPELLREIPDPPAVLYSIGAIIQCDAVAVVGTRRDDARSRRIAFSLSEGLSRCGYSVVSGMAIGIDREAHCGALDAGGPTIAVLPGGVDTVYPAMNMDLYRRILSTPHSAVLSEYPPGIRQGKWTFVRRNRIISGLCLGTVVIKAAARSGALITARHALEQNREVFACPGHTFDAEYAGCHRLIREGAVLVSDTGDITAELGRGGVAESKNSITMHLKGRDNTGEQLNCCNWQEPDDEVQQSIMKILSDGDIDIDTIIRRLSFSAGDVHEAVMRLEMAGSVERFGAVLSKNSRINHPTMG